MERWLEGYQRPYDQECPHIVIDLQVLVTEMQQCLLGLSHASRYTSLDLKLKDSHSVYGETLGGESYTGDTEGLFEFSIGLSLVGLVECPILPVAEKIAAPQADLTRFYSRLGSLIRGQRISRDAVAQI